MSNAPTRKPRSLRHLPPPTPRSLLAGGLVLVLLLASIVHFTLTTYSLPAAFPTVLGLCLLGGILSMVIWALPGRRTQAVLVTLLATGVFLCLDWAQLVYGARACLTSLSVFWTAHTDYTWYYPLTNSLPDLQHQAAVSVFLGTALALLALPLGWAILRLRSFTLVFALTLPWLMPAFLAESELDWPALLTLCACWATLLLSGLSARGDANGGARLILIALPACLAVVWGVFLLFPQESYIQPAWAVNLKEELLSLEWFPGEGSGIVVSDRDTGAEAPRLAFRSVGPRKYTGRGMFQVTTSQPGSMYLRGDVYRDYTGQDWTGVEPLSTENLGTASADKIPGSATATVTYLTYLGSTAYLPYHTVLLEDKYVTFDSALAFPAAVEEYTVTYTPLEDSPSRQNIPSLAQQEEVYGPYLEVPEEVSGPLLDWLTQAMEELEASGDEVNATATGEYASELNTAALIAQLLQRSAQYDLSTPRTPSGEDFVTYFLQESHRGYCVHFATAATLLLRLQGIPARYVSGYATSISSTSYIAAGNATTYFTRVLDSNAHAWVEIYLDGYGWYPVEVTPTDTAPDPSDPDKTPAVSAAATPTPAPTPTPETAPKPTPTSAVTPETPWANVSLLWLVWAIPFVALGAALWLVRHLRFRSWKKMCHDRDTNAAVLAAYRWFGQLERWGGKAGAETEALARKARFSQHTLTPQERSLVLRQLWGEIARLKQAAPAWRRWLLWLMFPVDSARRAG